MQRQAGRQEAEWLPRKKWVCGLISRSPLVQDVIVGIILGLGPGI